VKAAVALAAVCIVLSGCARLPPVPATDEAASSSLYRERAELLTAINAWELRGRIAVSVPADPAKVNGKRGGQAQFHWLRSGSDQTITLSGPFNRGALRIETGAHGARIRYPNGETRSASNVEALVEQETGWPLPVSALDSWLLGLAVPNKPANSTLDASGRLITLDQTGWQIKFEKYENAGETYPSLPHRLDLARQSPGDVNSETLTVRIAIDEFSTQQVTTTGQSPNP
jgi:outer membrane lipoprotein LolB